MTRPIDAVTSALHSELLKRKVSLPRSEITRMLEVVFLRLLTRRSEMPRPIDQIPELRPERKEVKQEDGSWMVWVTPPVILGPKPTAEVRLTAGQYNRYVRWRHGDGMIQDLLPELSGEEREKLMTGIMPDDPVWTSATEESDE